MFKIGDFSRLSRISIKALRYYDDIGLLRPGMVDRFTGYRYYSADQLPRLNRIVVLKNLGLSLEEVAKILDEKLSPDIVGQLLKLRIVEIRQRLNDEKERLGQVEEWLKQIEKEGIMPAYDVVLKKLDKQTVASLRRIIPSYQEMHLIFDEFCSYLEKEKAQWAGPPMALYYDCEYKERDVDVEVVVPIIGSFKQSDRIKVRELQGIEQAACTIHKGPYEKLNEAYSAMMVWLDKNRYEMAGPNRELYLVGPGPGIESSEYVTELQLAIVKK